MSAQDDAFKRACADVAWRTKAEKWLISNPPPPNWQGTPLEWAYTEMPGLPWWLTSWK